MKFTCTICNRFASSTLKRVLRHIGSVHSFEPGFQVTCGIEGCTRTYSNFRSFQKHLARNHETALNRVEDSSPAPRPQVQRDVHESDDDDTLDPIDANDCSTTQEASESTQKALQRSAALFLLRTKEVNRVTQVALNEIVEGVTELFEAHASAGNCCTPKPFAGLETHYLQQKYYKEEFKLVVSIIILS